MLKWLLHQVKTYNVVGEVVDKESSYNNGLQLLYKTVTDQVFFEGY